MVNISPDLGMALFALGAATVNARNCWLLWNHKRVLGFSAGTVIFYTAGNVWSTFFWWMLDQPLAFTAGFPMTFFNMLWLCMAWRYRQGRDH